MKKIIIVINNLETGGVQKSLLNLLKEIAHIYDVTLIAFFGNPAFEESLPQSVKCVTLHTPFSHLGMSAKDTAGNLRLFLGRAFWKALTAAFGRSFAMKLMFLFRKKRRGYDVAISYLHEAPQKNLYGGCNEFVLKMVEAEQKIAWLHCDFRLCGANNAQSKRIYQQFHKIVACSDGCRDAFVACIPQLAHKTISLRNCNDYEQIKALAGDGITYDRGYFNIVTVARLAEEKGIERGIRAVQHCLRKGYKIKYHVIGSGDQAHFLKDTVCKAGLEETVVFYGNQTNPYPYIVNADLFLLTSYHEAAPMVFDEAACLGVPVLATETTSTREMIADTGAGFVCANTQEGLQDALEAVLAQPDQLQEVKKTLQQTNRTNEKTVNDFLKMLESASA